MNSMIRRFQSLFVRPETASKPAPAARVWPPPPQGEREITLRSMAESGVRDFDVTPWFGLFGPGRMPAAVVRRINTDVAEILRSKDVVDKLAQQGADPLITEPQKFADILKADIDKWGQVVRASGASVD